MNMKTNRLVAAVVGAIVCVGTSAQAQGDMDSSISGLADNLVALVKQHANKKVTVLDFTDLQGGQSELGRYIAEQLTMDLVMSKHDFAVLDRANLKSILAEHKLTAEGLVNPDNAKQLGQFAGVDALIIGNIIPINSDIKLNVKIITTDTAEIVGGAKSSFKSDATVEKFLAQPVARATSNGGDSGPQDGPAVIKNFGDLQVQLQSLHVVSSGEKEFLLTMVFTNQNPSKSIWVAINTDLGMAIQGTLTDPQGNEFKSTWSRISGIAYTAYQHGGFFQATQINPNDAISATMKFRSDDGVSAAIGTCRLQLEILLGHEYHNNFGQATVQNLTAKVQAN
jgi:curli biogenesis system outer membrane secretion channel CsgG